MDSELEYDSDLGEVEEMEEIELESTQEQMTMVLGLQSGKSWAEVEGKLRGSYSGASIQTAKRRQDAEKEKKKHARQFNKMTKYFKSTGSGSFSYSGSDACFYSGSYSCFYSGSCFHTRRNGYPQ